MSILQLTFRFLGIIAGVFITMISIVLLVFLSIYPMTVSKFDVASDILFDSVGQSNYVNEQDIATYLKEIKSMQMLLDVSTVTLSSSTDKCILDGYPKIQQGQSFIMEAAVDVSIPLILTKERLRWTIRHQSVVYADTFYEKWDDGTGVLGRNLMAEIRNTLDAMDAERLIKELTVIDGNRLGSLDSVDTLDSGLKEIFKLEKEGSTSNRYSGYLGTTKVLESFYIKPKL